MPNWRKVIVSGSDASLNSLNVSAGITGSLFGTASWSVNAITASYFSGSISNAIYAETASYVTTAQTASYFFTSSVTSASYAETSNSSSYALTASYSLSSSYSNNSTTASYAQYVEYANVGNKPTLISSSAQIATDISGAFTSTSASLSATINNVIATTVTTSSFNSFTSSYTTGSFTGSFSGNGSGLTGVISSSYAESASYALTSSYSISSSQAISASTAISSSQSITSSYALTASYSQNLQISGSINNVDYIDFNTGSAEPAWKSGRVYWNNTDGALSVYNAEADISLQVGQENWVRVRNDTGVLITNGTAVRLIGSHGDAPEIQLARAIQVSGSITRDNQILGIATHDIEINSFGYITTQGLIRGLNTSAYLEGDRLFVSSSAGKLTKIPPTAPYEIIPAAVVVKAGPGGSGILYAYPQQPMDFTDLSSVEIGDYTYGDIFTYIKSGSVGVWKHTNQLSGSYGLTGSLNVINGGITGSLFGTASYATNAATASFLPSNGTYNITVSQSINAQTASYVNPLVQNVIVTGSLNIVSGSLTITGSTTTDLVRITQTGTGAAFIVEDSNNPDSTPLVIDSSGQLGIGTTTPSTRLHVISTENANWVTTIDNASTGGHQIYAGYNNGTSRTGLYIAGGGNDANTFDLRIGTSKFVVVGDGSVGIGTITPNSKLEVNGNTNITGSLTVTAGITGSLFGTASYSANSKLFDGNNTAVFATTASNTFKASQTITGSLTITNDLIVLGSSSIQYITSSQLNIATNLINVNTNTPAIRFGGIAVNDSGSSPIRSGSFLFDSQENHWLAIHENGGGVTTSSLFLMGPETYNSVGSETHPTTNRVLKSVNDEHVGDSNITDTGTLVSINSNTQITGSVLISGSLTVGGVIFGNGGMSMSGSNSVTGSLIISGSSSSDLVRITQTGTGNAFVVEDSTNPDSSQFVIDNAGNVGIGSSPQAGYKLYVVSPTYMLSSNTTIPSITGENTGDFTGTYIGVYGYAAYADSPYIDAIYIGGKFIGTNGNNSANENSYSVQLQDGSEGIGKVLVSQTADGKAQWSTKLSGSYEITGSLNVSGSYNSPAGNTIDSNALVQASLLYLSNNF